MTLDRTRHAARLLAAALLVPLAAYAQAPAAPEAKPAPAPAAEAKDAAPAAKDAAPAASDAAKEAPKEAPKAAAKDEGKGGAKDAAAEPAATGPLAMMAWLAGCWKGEVNKREFREFWHPPRGNLMVGVSRTALPERTISFEYLRLEPKADGIYYVSGSPGKPESAFKLVQGARDGNDEIYTFKRGGADFPSTLVYRRAGGGWLYIEVAGQVKGRDDKVTYPFRRVDCETGEFIRK
ncbi:MAG: DUF6265 family protein [Burkholderiales bacterium]